MSKWVKVIRIYKCFNKLKNNYPLKIHIIVKIFIIRNTIIQCYIYDEVRVFCGLV